MRSVALLSWHCIGIPALYKYPDTLYLHPLAMSPSTAARPCMHLYYSGLRAWTRRVYRLPLPGRHRWKRSDFGGNVLRALVQHGCGVPDPG